MNSQNSAHTKIVDRFLFEKRAPRPSNTERIHRTEEKKLNKKNKTQKHQRKMSACAHISMKCKRIYVVRGCVPLSCQHIDVYGQNTIDAIVCLSPYTTKTMNTTRREQNMHFSFYTFICILYRSTLTSCFSVYIHIFSVIHFGRA